MLFLKNISSNIKIVFLIFILCLIVYYPVFNAEYIHYDDNFSIIRNQQIVQPFTLNSLINIFTTFADNQYTPLSIMSYWLEYNALLCFDSHFSHRINLAIHIISAVLLFFLSLELFDNKKLAFIIASIWAIHPLQVCSVAWLTGRRTLLYGLFFIASLLFYSKYINTKNNKNYIIALIAMILSGFSKTLAFSIPFIWLILDWIKNRKFNYKIISEKITAFFIAIALVYIMFSSSNNNIKRDSDSNTNYNFKDAFFSTSYYAIQTIFPHDLYPLNEINQYTLKKQDYTYIFFLSVVAIFTTISLKSKIALFGFIFYIINIIPLSGLIRVGYDFILQYHYLYIPILGILLVLIEGFRLLTTLFKNKRTISITLFITALTFFSIKANQFSTVYQTSEKLLLNTVEIDEYNQFARRNLILYYLQRQEYDKAEYHWEKMFLFYPDFYFTYYSKALSIILQNKKNELEKAIQLLKKANQLNIYNDENVYPKLIGDCYLRLHNWFESEKYYSMQIEIDSNDIESLLGRAKTRRKQGKYTLSNKDYNTINLLDKENLENKLFWLMNSIEMIDYYQSFFILLDIINYISNQQEYTQDYFKSFCIFLYNLELKQYLPYYTYLAELCDSIYKK